MIHFAYGFWVFSIAMAVVIGAAIYRWFWYKPASYSYSLTSFLSHKNYVSTHPYKKILFVIRSVSLLVLAFLLAKPQLVDTSSQVHGEGIDIIVVLDVSGSMLFFDDPRNPHPRIEIAKEEALRFIEKRTSDPIGLVIFGREAVSRCPLTLDKNILKDIISHLHIGVIREDGTVLAKGMMVAASRLKNSKSKSKIMIVLTDGEPSPEDSSPDQAIELAQKMGIKVYTIGIGDTNGGYFEHPQLGVIPGGSNLNRELLKKIAYKTGGKYFEARKAEELRLIYDQIDRLEKTQYETTIYNNFYDIFVPFVWGAIGLLAAELVLSTFVWFAL